MTEKFLLILILVFTSNATKLRLNLNSFEKQCFYELLRKNIIYIESQQKYSIDLIPKTQGKY